MRISDWSSDVCSSDLVVLVLRPAQSLPRTDLPRRAGAGGGADHPRLPARVQAGGLAVPALPAVARLCRSAERRDLADERLRVRAEATERRPRLRRCGFCGAGGAAVSPRGMRSAE